MPALTHFQRFGLLFAGGALALAGCSRQAFRERADKDVEAVISQKNVVPQWQVQNWHVYPDARARFADPSCPDFPAYPPDDYAAKLLSPNPQKPGKGGVGRHEGDGWLKQIIEWDSANRSEDAASDPASGLAPPPVTAPADASVAAYENALKSQERTYRLRLEQAVELALYNSREFQDRREDLYLAALPVTLERFGFTAQAFAAEQVIRGEGGANSSAPGGGWNINTTAGVGRRFSTGATLLVQLANQVVIDLSSGTPTLSTSTLGLTLVQPLLRGGGFAVTLENLTQAERNLLYGIRSYSRFRSRFYTAIVGQGDYTNNPYGLQGLSANLGRGVGANLTANQIGYLPTILRSAILANEVNNVRSFESYLLKFQNLQEGGAFTKLQVGRVEQQLLLGRATVLTRNREYVDNIDNFKLQLGIPATVPLELDESPLKPIRDQLKRYEKVFDDFNEAEKKAEQFDPAEAPAELRTRWTRLLTASPLAQGTPLAEEFPKAAEALRTPSDEQLKKKLENLAKERRKLFEQRDDKLKANQPAQAEKDRIEEVENEIDRAQFEVALRRYEAKPWAGTLDKTKREAEQALIFRAVFNRGMNIAVQGRNQRLAKVAEQWPKTPAMPVDDQDVLAIPLDVAYEKVASAALNNRLDLMNARAQVVDAWRQVTVRANALQGVFDVEYDLSTQSPPGVSQPFRFGGSRTLNQIRLRLEPPFVRRNERNNYRAALIAYQRQRRNLMAFEDNIVTNVRTDLRSLRQLEQSYQVQRRTVELAYSQLDNARSTLNAPPDPNVGDSSAGAAAQTEQFLQVQSALVRAQNDLYTIWVQYLNARMNFYLDLELLILDARGIWTDDATAIRPAAIGTAPTPAPTAPDAFRAAGRPLGIPVDPRDGNRVERLPEPLPALSVPEPEPAPARFPAGVPRADPFPPLELPPVPGGGG